MLWLPLVIIAALFHSGNNIIDKYVINHELRDPYIGSFFWGIFALLLFCSVSLIYGEITLNPLAIGIGLLSGFIYSINTFFYYKTISKEEISRVIPALSLSPVFVAIIAFFVLNEVLSVSNYIGVSLIFLGTIVVSLRHFDWKVLKNVSFRTALIISMLFAVKNVSNKFIAGDVSLFAILFWIGIGAGILAVIFRIFHHPHLKKKMEKSGSHHLMISSGMSVIGSILFTIAIIYGPVSLVTFVHKIQIIFVFLFSTILDIFKPNFLEEQISKIIIAQKATAILLILAGSYLLV